MHSHYTILLLALALLLIMLHNYEDLEYIFTSAQCSPRTNLCVACPHLASNVPPHLLAKYLQISFADQFFVLGAFKHYIIKNQCRDMLEVMEKNEKGDWMFIEPIEKDLKDNKLTFLAGQQVDFASGVGHHLALSDLTDFVVFYEGMSHASPDMKSQNSNNPPRLMKLSRSMAWGMLLALLLRYIDSKIGWVNAKSSLLFPVMEGFILSFVLNISYELQDFGNLYIAEIMFMAYLMDKLDPQLQLQKTWKLVAVALLSLLAVWVHAQFTILGYLCLTVVIKLRIPQLKNSQPRVQVVTVMVLVCLTASILQGVGSLNYLTYSAFASKIIVIPLSFLLFQGVE